MLSRRTVNVLGFLICAGLLAYGYYLQYVQGLEPCPLCMFQRIALMALGVVFLLAAVHSPRGWGGRVWGVLVLLVAGAGAALSGRHVWLQSLPPDQVPQCGMDLETMLDILPLQETIRTVLTASGECADISWTFLGLSIPAWTLVWFVLLGLAGLAGNWAGPRVTVGAQTPR